LVDGLKEFEAEAMEGEGFTGTVQNMDVLVERTGTYSQRVLVKPSPSMAHSTQS